MGMWYGVDRFLDVMHDLAEYFVVVLFATVPAGLVLGTTYLVSRWWPQAGLGIYGGAIVLSLIMALLARPLLIRNPSADDFAVSRREPIESPTWIAERIPVREATLVVAATPIFVIGSGQFFRYWNYLFGGFSVAPDAGYWDWVRYSLSWVLDNTLANAGQIFGWDFSTIHPSAQSAQFLIFGYNLMLEFLLLVLVVRLIRRGAVIVVRHAC